MKTVLITGASRGIGKSTAEKFLLSGYEVFKPTRAELDLSSALSVSAFLNKYQDVSFDTIINNAGINDINLLENVSDEELLNMLEINMVSPIKLLRGLISGMKKRNYGRIINIASIWAVVSKEGRSIYSATKNAMHGITNTLALELAPYNILVNTVCPGFTLTELTKKNNSEEQIKEISREIPMNRMAKPEEIANVIYFLGSEENTYITGQKICADGGFTVR